MRYLLALLLGFGVLLSRIHTVDGDVSLYRDGQLCVVTWNGTLVQVVDLDTCLS